METSNSDIHEILRRHWGYEQFRPLQQDIIEYVLQGKDALALLPTGGGKSICFQVPALAMRGVCIVISPLIALMKDQVENLKKRGIPAEAVYTGLSQQETELIFNAAVHGRIKFLYVSPERCQNQMFLAHLQRMQVCLLAVDEAHCVSQWGYDFRPPYLQIADLRAYLPGVPLLALTATATPDVVTDIQDKLRIQPRKVFQKSFVRDNLTYYVIYDEDKIGRLERIIRKVGGSGIVYVRNRRKTMDIAAMLRQRGITADFYHGGMDNARRSQCQQDWIENKTRVIVATNAFGMGIDKPDVRFVVHLDLPDTIEAYFQEAGRAGRDEKRAFAVLLYHPSDRTEAQRNLARSYPPSDFIKRVYEALGNHLGIPTGSGEGVAFPFNISEFCHSFHLPVAETFSALFFLEREGYLRLSETAHDMSKVHMKADYDTVYRYQVAHPAVEDLLKMLLRMYGGKLFSDYVPVNEQELGLRLHQNEKNIQEALRKLLQVSVLDYIPVPEGSTVTFLQARKKTGPAFLHPENYAERKENAFRKSDAMAGYATERQLCRNRYLLQYLGEDSAKDCGHCDICLARKAQPLSEKKLRLMTEKLQSEWKDATLNLHSLPAVFPEESENACHQLWQYLLAEERIVPCGALGFRWRT